MRRGVDVAEDGGNLLPLQGMGRGDEGEGRNDDLTFEPRGADHKLQRHGGVTGCDTVLHPRKLGNVLLELLYEAAAVREPAAVQHVADAGQEALMVPTVSPSNMDAIFKGRRTAEDSKVIDGTLHTNLWT